MHRITHSLRHLHAVLILAVVQIACGDGLHEVRIYGEDFVEDAIPAEAVADGWRIELTELLVVIDELAIEGDQGRFEAGEAFVVDLAGDSGGGGHRLTELAAPAGEYERMTWRLAAAADRARPLDVPDTRVALLAAQGWSMLVRGQAVREDRVVAFSWGFDTDWGHDCAISTRARKGHLSSSQITLHADHLFFDDLDLPEPGIRFDLIAEADVDGDAEVSADELRAVDLQEQELYQVGGRPIRDLWSYLEAQTLTLGHIDGEGHCADSLVPQRWDERTPGSDDDGAIERGAELFARNCVSCHGEEGRGEPTAGGLFPPVTDLTRLGSAGTWGYLRYRIAEGGAFAPYGSAMPAYETVLSEVERDSLVAYVRSLAG